ncbi:MAG: tetratricopeptide repeat protein [Nitrosotalea sp.]
MKKLFRSNSEPSENKDAKPEMSVDVSKESKLIDPNYTRDKMFKKGVSFMADERMDDAAQAFEKALQMDPGHVDSLLKLGYARFHIGDFAGAMESFDKVHEIDVTNSDSWNLKSLIYYKQKNYEKALSCVEKAIETNPTDGMFWYNKACYHSLLNQVSESIEALKRSIEIDVKNAKKAVRDRDFENAKADEGYRRIVEVVVLESVRQGYHKVGQIVWTTMLGKAEVEDAARKLLEKGLLVKVETNVGLTKVEEYEIAPDLAAKIGVEKKGLFGTTKKTNPLLIQHLKAISEAVQAVKNAIEKGDVNEVIAKMDAFIDPSRSGAQMIEHFFEEHRDIRLFKARLLDKGYGYLQANKQKMIEMFDHIESQVMQRLRSETAQNT